MPDIFGRIDQKFGGGLSADSLFMVWPALPKEGAGLLVQNVSLQYTQPVRRIFELGPGTTAGGVNILGANVGGTKSQLTYYIVGRPEGNFQIARIFGFAAIGVQFYKTYGNPCNENPDLTLSGNAGCNGVQEQTRQRWIMNGVIISAIAMTATAQEMIIQEQVTGMFVSLNIEVT